MLNTELFKKFFPDDDPIAPINITYSSRININDGEILDNMPKFTSNNPYEMDSLKYMSLEFRLKEAYNDLGMYAFVSWDWIDPLVNWIGTNRCLEVMAGRGWLSYALRKRGVSVKATDNFSWSENKGWLPPLTEVEDLDAVKSVQRYGKEIDILFIGWPYMSNDAYKVIKNLHRVNPNAIVVYIGEGPGGCTADDEFFDHFETIEDNEFNIVQANYQSWWGIRDYPWLGRFYNG